MKTTKKIRSGIILIAAFTVVLSVLRFFFLPQWVSSHIDRQVKNITDFDVAYADYSISLLNGSYSIQDVSLKKDNSKLPVPFFQCEAMRIAFDFSSLFKDQWVSKITVKHPVINFIKGPDDVSSQTKISSEWIDAVKSLAGLPVNSMEISEGEINYHDYHSIPKVLLSMSDINLEGKNLYNRNEEEKILSGTVEGHGKVADGTIQVKMELNAFYQNPMFSLTAELVDLNLADVSDFLKAYGKVEVQQGIFSLYTEAQTKNNKVIGYVKPVIEDVTVAALKDDNNEMQLVRPSLQQDTPLWVVTANNSGKWNEIRFEGDLTEPGMNLWSAAAITLHNAFVEALVTTLERTVKTPDIGTPRQRTPKLSPPSETSADAPKKKDGFLKRIFKGKNSKRKKN